MPFHFFSSRQEKAIHQKLFETNSIESKKMRNQAADNRLP